ncbi:MAG: alpha/beta hydrolase [Bacteroidota bacterium]
MNMIVNNNYEEVEGVKIFYREAGEFSKKAIVLMHGFPTSSHMFRELLSALGETHYVIAPDYPGFGHSDFPGIDDYTYTFENIASTMYKFLEQKGIEEFIFGFQDYGAPISFRIAVEHPEKVKGLIAMNGNAYKEGLGDAWQILYEYWKEKSPDVEKTITENVFTYEGLKWAYTHGTSNPDSILPDNWELDFYKFSREGQHRMQLDLFYDYQNNVQAYPKWQQFMKDHQPPTLIIWGKNDAYFPESAAEAFKKDLTNIKGYYILDTGHFPTEEYPKFIIEKIKDYIAGL